VWSAIVESTRAEHENNVTEKELIDLRRKKVLLGKRDIQNHWRTGGSPLSLIIESLIGKDTTNP